MADFSLPVPQSNYVTLLDDLKNRDLTIAKMFDGTTDTNVPTGAIKYNSTNKRLEKWDGTTWQPQQISNFAAGSIGTADVAADAIDDTKFRGRNGGWLRWRNAANSGDVNAVLIDSFNNLTLQSSGSALTFNIGGAAKWQIQPTVFYPAVTDTFSFGSPSYRVLEIYAARVKNCDLLEVNGGPMTIGPASVHDINFKTSNSVRWILNSAGNFVPNGAFSLGTSAQPVNALYTNTISGTGTSTLGLYADSYINIAPGGHGWQFSLFTMTPALDNTHTIGTPSYNHSIVYANKFQNRAGDLWVLPGAGGGLTLGANAGLKWYLGTDGSLVPLATYNLGNNSNPIYYVQTGWVRMVGTDMYVGTESDNYVILRQNGLNRIELHPASAGGGLKFINFTDQPYIHGSGAAGTLGGYWAVRINGTVVKIALYHNLSGTGGGMPNGNP